MSCLSLPVGEPVRVNAARLVVPAPECWHWSSPPQSPVAQDPCPVLSKTHCRRPQKRPPTHGTGTEATTVALGSSSIPPADPLKTGTGFPAPATQTVSVQLFVIVNCRVCDRAIPAKP